ncbi:hexosaminidase [Flavobacteriaceae bacterium MAR_2010_72]|nr:hexosaminidase [Flavobacteriaceae bacterium MAR_2010_72]TVZ59419.1 hexosaminidase [Flavobacteriaceae bacterium MAR_2010_105]
MTFKKIIALAVFISFLFSCKEAETTQTDIKIIPAPAKFNLNDGQFEINSTTGLIYDPVFKVSAGFLKAFVENGSTFKLQNNNQIEFIKDQSIKNYEGYILNVSTERIEIRANSDHGAFYAVQSLRQLLPPEFENGSYKKDSAQIPYVTISDEPQFAYRGMHLDVARHMFSVAFIKKYIDALAMLKMNTFHWHLTDDQGWRIEIKKYPKLQTVAAFRDETLIGHYSNTPQQFDGKTYGGYYTQDQIKAIVAYAQKKHVTIIPEIEMPGHSQAAIAAYPELGCTGERPKVASKWGVFEHIYCTKDATFDFLEDVLDEVLELFPSTYIHIGGDEAPKKLWKSCPNCQKRIKEEALKDEHELQSYFVSRIEKYLNSKGRQIIGWDEILEGGLAPNATVMSWRGTNGAIEAAKQGHNVVMTPTSHCYFDYYQSENSTEPLAIGGYLPLDKVYHFNPIPEELSRKESKYILGAQGNLWTEYILNEKQAEYMVFPRILAMSEVVWSKPERKNYKSFVNRVEQFHKRLEALDINYANHLYEIEGNLSSEGYELKTLTSNNSIHYTLDGTEPSLKSEVYTVPIPITQHTVLKAAIFNKEQQLGSVFKQHIQYHKAVGKQIKLNVEPNSSYPGSGAAGLINGISGSDSRYGDKEWLGFWGEDLEITIDLGEKMEVNSLETRFYNSPGQWIYAPKQIQIGLNKRKIDSTIKIQSTVKHTSLINIAYGKKTRYIYLKIPNYGVIPEGKQGAGHKAWTFIDEIIIR